MAMMECPRCGFTQPKDRYCANCGLDTENYTPKKPSVGQSIIKSPMLYISAGVITLVAVGMFLSKAPTPSSNFTNTFLDDTPEDETSVEPQDTPAATTGNNLEVRTAQNSAVTTSNVNLPEDADTREQGSNPTQPPPAQARETGETEDIGEEGEPTPVSAPPSAQTAPAVAATAPAGTNAAATVSQPTQIQVQFYEFPRAALATAAGQSQIVAEGDQYRILLHPNADELNNWLRGGRRLPGSRSAAVGNGSTLSANFEMSGTPAGGIAPPSTPINAGLTLDAVTSQLSAAGVNVEVRGLYHSVNPVRFSATQALTTNSTLLIFGVLPHSGIENMDPPSNSPLVVLDSPDFLDNLSEFVIVLSVR